MMEMNYYTINVPRNRMHIVNNPKTKSLTIQIANVPVCDVFNGVNDDMEFDDLSEILRIKPGSVVYIDNSRYVINDVLKFKIHRDDKDRWMIRVLELDACEFAYSESPYQTSICNKGTLFITDIITYNKSAAVRLNCPSNFFENKEAMRELNYFYMVSYGGTLYTVIYEQSNSAMLECEYLRVKKEGEYYHDLLTGLWLYYNSDFPPYVKEDIEFLHDAVKTKEPSKHIIKIKNTWKENFEA